MRDDDDAAAQPPLPPGEQELAGVLRRCELLEAELRETKAGLQHADVELSEKTAFFDAKSNTSTDGILVVDQQRQKIFQNLRMVEIFQIPPHIAEDRDDDKQVIWVAGMVTDPEQFIEKVAHLYSEPDAVSHDELVLNDGTILDRYSSPVVGENGKHYGRMWTFRDITMRKQLDMKLDRQQAEMRVLFDALPAFICFKDTENRILRSNQRMADLTGKSVAEIEGRPTAEIFPQYAAKYFADDLEVIQSGSPRMGIIETVSDREGNPISIQTDKIPVFDEHGKVTGLIAMAQDITESLRAKSELLNSQRFLRSTLNSLSSHIAILDEHGTIIEINAAWDRFARENNSTGNHPGVGDNYLQICDSASGQCSMEAPEVAAGIRAVMAGERADFQAEYPCHSPREYRWFVVRVTRFDGEGPVRVVVAHENISERKRTENSLCLLSSAVNQAKDSIMITDAEINLPGPRILFVNPAFTQMTGYPEEEVIGKTPRILQGPRTDRAVLDRLRACMERGESFEGETVNYRKDGTEFILEWQVAPIRSKADKITHFVAVERDITARKRVEGQLVQSQKFETVGKLAGGIAHEFNSILTAIIGQADLILEDIPSGSSLGKNATEISIAAKRAAALTRQLLAYGRKQLLLPEILDLNRFLAGMQNILLHVMGADVDIRIVPAPGLHVVKVDTGQLEQVIMNIVINAHEAMPNGGKLTLETANVNLSPEYLGPSPEAEVKSGDYVMLAISDTGTGMTQAVKARVFDPFFSTKKVGEGSGLGLSTSYGIVKQSGGHMSVYSEPGHGTIFKIYLPRVKEVAAPEARRLDPPGIPHGTETILLVEDDPALREMAATLLGRLGYTVLPAANGIEALAQWHQQGTGHIDLLFTDIIMPHMTGKELADRVRALHPQIQILFTSAYTENAIVHHGVLDPGVNLLQKPFTPSALAKKIRQVLDAPPSISEIRG